MTDFVPTAHVPLDAFPITNVPRMQPYFLLPGEGRDTGAGAGTQRAKVLGKDTGLLFGMWESHQEPHSRGPVLHYHARMTEMFWVLEGTLHVEAGDEVIDAPAGGFALVPPGTVHTFRNATEEPSKILIMFSPGFNREMYFEGMAEHRRRDIPPTPDEVLELMHSFDQYLPGEIASEIIAKRGG
jgi:quercetin dioxygenase-like cupin family protein